jgi:very-short-patch-repair endonuclease
MEREDALILIQQKNWDRLTETLRDNLVFERLIGDPIFVQVFHQNFIRELLSEQGFNKDDELIYLSSVYTFHKSNSYTFELTGKDLENLLLRLFDLTGNIEYAKQQPQLPKFKEVLAEHHEQQVEKNRQIAISENLLIEEIESIEKVETDSIFKSPQEEEFYYAAKEVFSDSMILPNASLSMTLSSNILDSLSNEEKWFYLTSSVDIVIVDSDSHKPTHFFELDSGFHDNPKQIEKDNLKNRLISECGHKLYRLRKKQHQDQTQTFIDWLTSIKNGG